MTQQPETPKKTQIPSPKQDEQTVTTPSTPNPKAPKPASENTQTPLWIAILITCLIELPQGIDAWLSLVERIPQLNNIPYPSGIIWKKDSDSPKI